VRQLYNSSVLLKAGFRIRIHFLRNRIRIRIQRIRMEANTDPDPDTDPDPKPWLKGKSPNVDIFFSISK
jgi:hypothetical protein